MRTSRSRSGDDAPGRASRCSISRTWRSVVRMSRCMSETRFALSGRQRLPTTLRRRASGGNSGAPASCGPPSSQ
jgi:hypothetical protein